jgi:hypothetical protein
MMALQIDICLELLVNLSPDGWAQWITGLNDVVVMDLIHIPCPWVRGDRELLIKVKSGRQGEFMVLNRWELDYNRNVPGRIAASAGMAREKYRLPVYPVLVNVLRPSYETVISNSFESSCFDLQVRRDFKVVNLWEVKVELAFTQSLAVLLPFAPIMLGGNNEDVVRRAAIALEAENEFEELEQLLATFGSCALGLELMEEIMGLQVEALRASPIADVLRQEGQQDGTLEMLKVVIALRFGNVPEFLDTILIFLSTEELQQLVKPLLEAKAIDEFVASIHKVMEI